MAGKSQKCLLLCVRKRERLQPPEDDGMVRDDDGRIQRDGLVGDSLRKIDGKEDRIRLATGRDEGCFEEEPGVVP